MRFTLDGESFELTPELIRASLQGWTPEEVREYWVDIDGVRWPVKQVVALGTGAKRSRFQSQDSRRWLHNLGFPIGAGSSIISPQLDASRRDLVRPCLVRPICAGGARGA